VPVAETPKSHAVVAHPEYRLLVSAILYACTPNINKGESINTTVQALFLFDFAVICFYLYLPLF
jgi:hypothetical protein